MCVCLCVRACMRVWDGGRVCVCGGGGGGLCVSYCWREHVCICHNRKLLRPNQDVILGYR